MKLILLPLTLLAFSGFAQKAQIAFNLGADFPNRNIMPKMGVVKNLGFGVGIRPVASIPVYLEAKGTLGFYSYKVIPQTYVFGNGDQTKVNVNYNSNMHKILFGTKIQIGNQYRLMNFFVTPQIGGAFLNSRIYIEDPSTQNGECKALESSHPHRSNVGVYGGEIGTQINLSRNGNSNHRLNLSANFLAGFRQVEYINVKYMKDEPHPATESPMTHEDGRDVTATFINVTTNATHDHKIAELYKTPLQMWGFSIGYVFTF